MCLPFLLDLLFLFIHLSHRGVEQVELRRDGVGLRRVFLGLLDALGVLPCLSFLITLLGIGWL